MSQENKQSKMEKGDGQRKGPKFNIYWVYRYCADSGTGYELFTGTESDFRAAIQE